MSKNWKSNKRWQLIAVTKIHMLHIVDLHLHVVMCSHVALHWYRDPAFMVLVVYLRLQQHILIHHEAVYNSIEIKFDKYCSQTLIIFAFVADCNAYPQQTTLDLKQNFRRKQSHIPYLMCKHVEHEHLATPIVDICRVSLNLIKDQTKAKSSEIERTCFGAT